MSSARRHAFTATLSVAILGISTGSAYAYLDPGTGSMILQVLLGGLAGAALVGRMYWHKLTSLFHRARVDTAMPDKEPPDPRR